MATSLMLSAQPAVAAPTRPDDIGAAFAAAAKSQAWPPVRGSALRTEIQFNGGDNDIWAARVAETLQQLLPHHKLSLSPECPVETVSAGDAQFRQFYLLGPAPGDEPLKITFLNTTSVIALARKGYDDSTTAEIVLSRGLFAQIQLSSELAFVLSHELAHIEFEHFTPQLPLGLFTQRQLERVSSVHIQWELKADARAIERLTRAGFSTLAIAEFLSRLDSHTEDRDPAHLHSHPTLQARLDSLQQTQKLLVTAGLK